VTNIAIGLRPQGCFNAPLGRSKNKKPKTPANPPEREQGNSGSIKAARPASTVKGGKLWLFRLAAILLFGVILFGALELGLRLFGFGYPTRFFLAQKDHGKSMLIENPKFLWRFMPRNLARAPRPLLFPQEKAPNTIRVFVLGESAAMGDPKPVQGIPQVLNTLLRARYPERHFEIINVAITAINSHVILPLAQECAGLQGDFWLVYMGNNEVHGPFGPGTAFGKQVPNRNLLRLSLALKKTRIGQLIERVANGFTQGDPIDPARGLEAFLDQEISPSDPRLEAVYRNFQENLSQIIALATRENTPVIVSTVASNSRDFAPLGSQLPPTLTSEQEQNWKQAYDQGMRQKASSYEEALASFQKAETIASDHADLQFQLGTCLWHLQQPEKAKQHFIAAREQDTLRFRADTRINELIRTKAEGREQERVYLIDAERAIEQQSNGEIPGDEWFWDHVHFRFPGNYKVARLAAEEIARQLPPPTNSGGATNWLTIDECAERLAITHWGQHQLTTTMIRRLSLPPFTHQSNHQERIAKLRRQLLEYTRGLETAAYEPQLKIHLDAIATDPDDWNLHDQLGKFHEAFDHPDAAISEWKKIIDLVPHHFMARLQIGHRLLQNPDTLSEAISYLSEAARMRPYAAEVRHELGMAYAKQGSDEAAAGEFAAALDLDKGLINTYIAWAVVLARMDKPDQAAAKLRQALELRPDSISAHLNLAALLASQNDRLQALQHYKAVLRLNPQHREALEAVRSMQSNPSSQPSP